MPSSNEIRGTAKVLVAIGGSASVGLGVWHFFVPSAWDWYSYMDPAATELVLSVRAINVLFSLSLILFGAVNVLLAWGKGNRYSVAVVLAANMALWITRTGLQLVWPQGSMNPILQYGMLATFGAVALCYGIALRIVLMPPE